MGQLAGEKLTDWDGNSDVSLIKHAISAHDSLNRTADIDSASCAACWCSIPAYVSRPC
jgi:hypothetical protein